MKTSRGIASAACVAMLALAGGAGLGRRPMRGRHGRMRKAMLERAVATR